MEIKRKTVSKKVWCVGQSTHNPLRFAIFEGGPAGRLTQTRKNTHKPISELSVVPECYAVQTTIGILRITATTNHATVRHDLVPQGHNSLAEHNWVLPTPNLEGQVRHPTRGSPFLWAFTIVFTMVFTMIVLCFLHVLPWFLPCFLRFPSLV